MNDLNAQPLQHSTGNAGWSAGFMQWGVGQGPVRQAQVDTLLDRLNGFLRSDPGRAFVAELDGTQMQRKWDTVGEPPSRMDWWQTLGRDHPDGANQIVAMTTKLFNENETRGGRLLDHLRGHPFRM